MKQIGIIVLAVAAIGILIAGSWAFRYYTAPIKGTVDAEVRLESADSRIRNYNHFFDLCSQVQSMKQSIRFQQDRLEQTVDNKDRSRILANIAGMKSQLSRYVNQYNADASKRYTAARFRSASLPYTLSIEGNTTCN